VGGLPYCGLATARLDLAAERQKNNCVKLLSHRSTKLPAAESRAGVGVIKFRSHGTEVVCAGAPCFFISREALSPNPVKIRRRNKLYFGSIEVLHLFSQQLHAGTMNFQ
jgi:hypothetical protein